MHEGKELHLLELAAGWLSCEYLSDLRYLDGPQRIQLVRLLEKLPADTADLREWNDTLEYLTRQPPEATAEATRASLLRALNEPVQIN